eukprot:tig00020816_g14145.t1
MATGGAEKRHAGEPICSDAGTRPRQRPRLSASSSEADAMCSGDAAALLGLPDALLVRIIRLACASEHGSGAGAWEIDEPFCCDEVEAKLRAVQLQSGPAESRSRSPSAEREPWVDLRRLCRLRRVCRRVAGLVETGGAAPRARLEISFGAAASAPDEAPSAEEEFKAAAAAGAELGRACEGAARVGGIEELDLKINPHRDGDQPRSLPAFSLAPLRRFRSLRALRLRLRKAEDGSCPAGVWGPEHLSPLAALPRLSCLDLRDGARGLGISPGALSALSPLPLTALRAAVCVACSSDVEKEVSTVAAAFPGLERLFLDVQVRTEWDRLECDAPAGMARPLTPLSSLKALSLSFCGGSDFSLAPLAPLRRLEHLSLPLSAEDELPALSSLTSLRSLDLSGEPYSALPFLAPLTRLEALRLCLDAGADAGQLACLAPRLRCLELEALHEAGEEAGALADALLAMRFPALQARQFYIQLHHQKD